MNVTQNVINPNQPFHDSFQIYQSSNQTDSTPSNNLHNLRGLMNHVDILSGGINV
jgi:hypothetical protein